MRDISVSFGQRVRMLRQSKHLSQEKLAEFSGLHTTYIGQIERGEKSPTLDSIYKISVGLNVNLSKLFDNIDYDFKSTNIDYYSKIYNKVVGLDDIQVEKIYKIICDILDFDNKKE